LWLIFLDHIPSNVVSWITIRNYGFSDATEIFIFISGYTAAFVYGRAMQERGLVVASARILKRVWQIYVAHIFLLMIYLAEISYVAQGFENPLYAEEMKILDFFQQPDVTIIQAMLLKFKPVNMDVLPLYIILLLLFPPILWLLQRKATLALAGSVVIYALVWEFNWNLRAYPSGTWFFNPFAWQLLFVFGAWCALGGAERLGRVIRSPVTMVIAIVYLIFAFAVTMTWHFPRAAVYMPISTCCASRTFSHLPRSSSASCRGIGPDSNPPGCGLRFCAVSIRWKYSVSGSSLRLPATSPWSRFPAKSRCRSQSAR
jgi:hypothetical protein